MRYSTPITILALTAASASADYIKVAVGQNGLTFTPNNFAAKVGDYVEFAFFPKNHSVTESSFGKPCQPLITTPRSGIFSSFIPTVAPGPNAKKFTIKITDDKPIWLYCSQTTGNHCQSGMVAAINAPTTGYKTFENFVLLAANASTSTSPVNGAVSGGILGAGAADEGGVDPTYTSAKLTVTREIEYESTAVVNEGGKTITKTVVQAVPTTVTVESTWPVQSGVAVVTGGSTTSSAGNGGSSVSASQKPTQSLDAGNAASGFGVGGVALLVLGAGFALL